MDMALKILILEDSREDLELVERELKKGGLNFSSVVVKRKEEFIRALSDFRPDVVLSDHSLPQFNSIEAMELWKEYQQEYNVSVPFILITGSVSEEFAVQSIKAGADDYVLKDRLKRLPSSIRSALERVKSEKEKRDYMREVIANETLMREAEQLAHFGSWQVDLQTGRHQWSDEACRIFGYSPGEIDPNYEKFFKHVHPEDKLALKRAIDETISHLPSQECEYRIIDKDQQTKTLQSKIVVKRNLAGQAYQLLGFTLDITKQKEQTKSLETQNLKLMEIAWVQSHEVRAPVARIMGLTQLLKNYPEQKLDLPEALSQLLSSANELDEIIRKIVRKTEEIA
jgi:two-component system response regulator